MKRSEVNKALRELEAMCEKYHCYLPPFCHFTPVEWETKGHEYDEVRDCCLGWDITDYGMGNFDKMVFSLITIRNGHQKMADKDFEVEPGTGDVLLVPSAFMQAMSAFVAQNMGAGKPERAKKALFCGIASSLAAGIVMWYLTFSTVMSYPACLPRMRRSSLLLRNT